MKCYHVTTRVRAVEILAHGFAQADLFHFSDEEEVRKYEGDES
jgi:hypothetical protein